MIGGGLETAGARHAFLIGYGGGHIAMLLPVARQLRTLGWRVTLLALTTAAPAARAAGEPCLGFADLLDHAAPDALAYGEALCPDASDDGSVSRAETLAYYGISFADLVERRGKPEAEALYRRHGRQAFLPTDFMRRVLAAMRPDLVIATNSPRAEQAAILAAGELDIASLCLVDMFALQEVRWVGVPGYATRLCVLNDAVRAMMIEHGRAAHEVVVTGNPAFATIDLPHTRAAGEALRRERGWDDSRTTVLWASQVEPAVHPFTGAAGDPALPRRIEAALRDAVARHDGLRLVVRYHPSETIDFVPGERIEFSPIAEPLHPLIHAVDLVVVTASTVGLEAWLAAKPVLSVDASIFTADAPFSAMGIAQGVTDVGAIEPVVSQWDATGPVFPLPGQLPAALSPSSATHHVVTVAESLFMPSVE